MKHLSEIHMRDPFVYVCKEEKKYYLYGTTDEDPWKKAGVGFSVYVSVDLEWWEGPHVVFTPDQGFWGTHNFGAPEVHAYKNAYYMFASFKAENRCRGTHILISNSLLGPFVPLSENPVTPKEWECLDGTYFLDEENQSWIVFCHEWVQVNDGQICAQRLSEDLLRPIGRPELLFTAGDALWTKALKRRDGSDIKDARVTDGPFLHRTKTGKLLLLWSSISQNGYALGIATSLSGTLQGPWMQSETPLIDRDGGHGMVFTTFNGSLLLTLHSPNETPLERVKFFPVKEVGGTLQCL
ncbi:MAG: glycoside hydrolase [Bacteroidia bacterium]|nr:glycoside hydrolase [Bacteroidia bacterium]